MLKIVKVDGEFAILDSTTGTYRAKGLPLRVQAEYALARMEGRSVIPILERSGDRDYRRFAKRF